MKRCYFFGAGAEICLGLDSGKDFAKAVLGIGFDDMNEAIKSYYKSFNERDPWYPPFSCREWDEAKLLEAAIKRKHLEEDNEINSKKEFDEAINEEINNLQNNPTKRTSILDTYPSYMGILDEKFHTIISPKFLGPQKFWNVIACYTRAYLHLISKILLEKNIEITQEKYLEILKHPKETMTAIIDKCKPKELIPSYYKALGEVEHGNSYILTTNYTPFCKYITKCDDDNIAYLNGRFGLFESAYELQVYDAEKEELPNDILFPYIFVQSGVKPIVDIKQIQEYAKMIKFLKSSDELIIVGYRFNSDDNHINSILRSFLLDGRKITYFNYNSKSKKDDNLKKLRIKNKEVKFEQIEINKDNCYEMFKNHISQ